MTIKIRKIGQIYRDSSGLHEWPYIIITHVHASDASRFSCDSCTYQSLMASSIYGYDISEMVVTCEMYNGQQIMGYRELLD